MNRQRGFISITTTDVVLLCVILVLVVIGGWELLKWLFSHITIAWR